MPAKRCLLCNVVASESSLGGDSADGSGQDREIVPARSGDAADECGDSGTTSVRSGGAVRSNNLAIAVPFGTIWWASTVLAALNAGSVLKSSPRPDTLRISRHRQMSSQSRNSSRTVRTSVFNPSNDGSSGTETRAVRRARCDDMNRAVQAMAGRRRANASPGTSVVLVEPICTDDRGREV